MAAPFARSMRSLEADRGMGTRLIWAVALVLAAAWIAWFTSVQITVTSAEGARERLTPAQLVFRSLVHSR